MKKAKIVIAVFLSVLLLFSMSSCGNKAKNQSVREKSERMLDAILADDFQTAYSLVAAVCEETDFEPIFSDLHAYLEGVTSYELKQTGWHSSLKNGVTTYTVAFLMTAGDKAYTINAAESSDKEGLVAFKLYIEN